LRQAAGGGLASRQKIAEKSGAAISQNLSPAVRRFRESSRNFETAKTDLRNGSN
jgi:hypothetical protein